MPTSIIAAVIAGAASAGVAAITGAAIGAAFLGTFATTLVLSGLSAALAKKPASADTSAGVISGTRLVTIRQPITPWHIVYGQVRKGGALTFFERSADKRYDHLVITLAAGVNEEIGDIYFADQIVPLDGSGNATGTFAGAVRIKKSLGGEAGQPFPDLVAESASLWTDAHRQTGHTKIYVRLDNDSKLFGGGIPNITAVVKGRKLLDPRTSTTAWSALVGLCVVDYMTNSVFGLKAVYADEIDDDDAVAAINVCDEDPGLYAGGTEKRYLANGFFLTSEKPKDIINKLLGAMAGRAVSAGAKWHIHAGGYETPTLTLGDGDLDGPTSSAAILSRKDLCNGVKGIFTDPNARWVATDFPAVASSAYMAEDGGERLWRDLDLTPFVTSHTQAERLAKIVLLESRMGRTFTGSYKLAAYRAMTGRTVAIDNARRGYSGKAFRVENSRFKLIAESENDVRLGVELVLRETAAAVYDWTTSDEIALPTASQTTLPNPWTAGVPTGLTFVQDTDIPDRAVLSWTAPADALADEYQLEWQRVGAADWNVTPRTRGTAANVENLEPYGYYFRVKSYNPYGAPSAYTSAVLGLMIEQAVPNVTGLEIEGQGVDRVFTGRDLKLAWRRGSTNKSYDIGSEPFGGNSGAPDYYFKDFELVVWNPDYPQSLLLVAYPTEPFFVYTREMYYAAREFNYLQTGVAARELCISVVQRGKYNQKSAKKAQLTVSNPQIAAPSGETLTAKFNGFTLAAVRPGDPDFAGMQIFASTSSGFTPGAANLVYSGSDVSIDITGLTPNTTYYVRYAFFDDFDSTVSGLNLSAERSVTTAQVQTADIATSAIVTGSIAAGAVSASAISTNQTGGALSSSYTGSVGVAAFGFDVFTGCSVSIPPATADSYSIHSELSLLTGATAHTQGYTLDVVEYDAAHYADLGNATVTVSSYGGHDCLRFAFGSLPAAVTGSSGPAVLLVPGQPVMYVRHVDAGSNYIYASPDSSSTANVAYLIGAGTYPATLATKFYGGSGSQAGLVAGVETLISAIASTRVQMSKKDFSNTYFTHDELFLLTCRHFAGTAAGDSFYAAAMLVNQLKR